MTIAPVLLDAKAASGHIIVSPVGRPLDRRVVRAGCLTDLVGDRAGLLQTPGCQIQFYIHVCHLPRITFRPLAPRVTSTALATQGTRIVGRRLFRIGHLFIFVPCTMLLSGSATGMSL